MEVLIALWLLGVVVPVSMDALGNAFLAELRIYESASLVSSAEWWFSRVKLPANKADIDAAPKVDEHGKARFDWETENLGNGAIRVTLRVHGHLSRAPFTISRIF